MLKNWICQMPALAWQLWDSGGGGGSGGEEEEGPLPADRAEASYWNFPLVPVFLHFLGGLHVTVGDMCAGRRPWEAWASEQTLTRVPYLVA